MDLAALWNALNRNEDPREAADRDGITYRDMKEW